MIVLTPFLSLLLIFVTTLTSAFDQEKWALSKDEDGIKVYNRRSGDEKMKEIMVTTELPGTPAQLTAVIMDIAHHPKWVYGIKETKVLKTINEHSLIYYNVVDLPWPVNDRDMILHITATKNNASKLTVIQSKTVQYAVPLQKGTVRVPNSAATWKIKPLPDNKMQVEYVISVDPGGALPAWLVNSVATTGPYQTFKELRKMMQELN